MTLAFDALLARADAEALAASVGPAGARLLAALDGGALTPLALREVALGLQGAAHCRPSATPRSCRVSPTWPASPLRSDQAGGGGVQYPKRSDAAVSRADIYHAHPGILGGTPVFTGTRVPVDSLVHHLRTGSTLGEFLDDFPSVGRAQAEAFLALALNDALDLVPHDAGPA